MNLFFVYTNLLSSPSFWILSIVITVAALLPDFTSKSMEIMGIKPRTIYPGNSKNVKVIPMCSLKLLLKTTNKKIVVKIKLLVNLDKDVQILN